MDKFYKYKFFLSPPYQTEGFKKLMISKLSIHFFWWLDSCVTFKKLFPLIWYTENIFLYYLLEDLFIYFLHLGLNQSGLNQLKIKSINFHAWWKEWVKVYFFPYGNPINWVSIRKAILSPLRHVCRLDC